MPKPCSRCNTLNTDDSRFCEGCGAQMEPAAPPPGPPHSQQPAPPAGGQKAKKGGVMALAVILAVLLVGAIGTGVFLLLRGKGGPAVDASGLASAAPPPASLPPAPSSIVPAPTVSSVPQGEASSIASSVSPPTSQPAATAAADDPKALEVSLEDFDWYYDYEQSSGIPPNAKIIGDDVSRLYGAWKGLIRYDFEFETLYHTWGVGIEPSSQSDAAFSIYEKEASSEEGWVSLDNGYVDTIECRFDSNQLQFEMSGIHMGLLFWEEGNRQYAVCHFQMDNGVPGVMMLTREV